MVNLIADFERIKQQLNLAYSFNDKKIIAFSFSHHIIFDGNDELFKEYIKYLERIRE
ncbi:hypothetical protein [Haploplasma axanthum]|uniref:hypothetical protein n=1 Tax=Haploplasma axanthum TaxID=29552 RepID=UPI0003FEBB82|nr:hypothetical protein [Haploplasma axanthum]